MVPLHHHRKQDSGELRDLLPFITNSNRKPSKPTLRRSFFLFSIFSSVFLFAAAILLFLPSYPFSAPSTDGGERRGSRQSGTPCSPVANDAICCDRTALRTDVCFMRGDVRTSPASGSIFLVPSSDNSTTTAAEEERIRPYTRKWEKNTMDTIDELRLRAVSGAASARCDVRHDVPAVVFSTGGYTGNVYHEFNDGIIPLYITSRRFDGEVVFVIVEYHDWWVSKYENILSKLSAYPPVDFSGDNRTHCFPEAIVGLEIHDELAIDPDKMAGNRTIRDFRKLLDESYRPRIEYIEQVEEKQEANAPKQPDRKPKLVVVSRNGSRGIENEGDLVKLAEEVGFRVEVLKPTRTTELAKIYRALNSTDMMIGVHGAAMTHFLFMRPGSVFVQIVPLGTDWAAQAFYGEPAVKLGLKYVRYAILPEESSLHREYGRDDVVLRDPESVNARGWEVTKKVYLDGQKVRLDLRRFRKRLVKAHRYLVSRKS